MRLVSTLFALLVAASAVGAEVCVLGAAEADGKASVSAVITATTSDLLVLDGGHERGIRPGAVCSVTRAGRFVGSVVIAESARHRAVALILSLEPSAQINPGDLVSPRANPRL